VAFASALTTCRYRDAGEHAHLAPGPARVAKRPRMSTTNTVNSRCVKEKNQLCGEFRLVVGPLGLEPRTPGLKGRDHYALCQTGSGSYRP
jgi:hypothetical protein